MLFSGEMFLSSSTLVSISVETFLILITPSQKIMHSLPRDAAQIASQLLKADLIEWDTCSEKINQRETEQKLQNYCAQLFVLLSRSYCRRGYWRRTWQNQRQTHRRVTNVAPCRDRRKVTKLLRAKLSALFVPLSLSLCHHGYWLFKANSIEY